MFMQLCHNGGLNVLLLLHFLDLFPVHCQMTDLGGGAQATAPFHRTKFYYLDIHFFPKSDLGPLSRNSLRKNFHCFQVVLMLNFSLSQIF